MNVKKPEGRGVIGFILIRSYHAGLCWRRCGLIRRGLLLRWCLRLLIGYSLSWGRAWLLLIGSNLLLWHHGLRCCGDCWYAGRIVLHPRDWWDGWLTGERRTLVDHSWDWRREREHNKNQNQILHLNTQGKRPLLTIAWKKFLSGYFSFLLI